MRGLKHDALDRHEFFHLLLEIWERDEKNEMLRLSVHHEIYEMIGIYSVLQGVMLTTLTQEFTRKKRKEITCSAI